MEEYYRIANDSKVYDANFDSLEEAKNWLIANNIEQIQKDLKDKSIKGWRIEHYWNNAFGGCIASITRFSFDGEHFKFQETEK